jgi:sulfate adenylyltransferase large subunit
MRAPQTLATIEPSAARDFDTRPALRFLTCGSVDDGKSTLIGRLLYEQKLIYDDHLAALGRDSNKFGTTGADIDFALLLDGLDAEREQGITIDVAYRYFSTARRAFVVADTPGHEQYTRNMATGASNADLAVLLVDARKGLLRQTRRHAVIASLLGIRHVVLAINKIDLVGFDRAVFDQISENFSSFAAELGFAGIVAIPLSARHGDNVSARSKNTPWYAGPSLLEHLETVDVLDEREDKPLRMPVQWVNRSSADFRGFAGTIASGEINRGDDIAVLPSGRVTRVASIVAASGEVEHATTGDAVTLTLSDEVDVSRGDMIAAMRPATGRRSVRRASVLDVRRPFVSRPLLSHEDRPPHADGDGDRTQASGRCRYFGEARRQDFGRKRRRRLQSRCGEPNRLRSLQRQPRHRRFSSDRSLYQPNRRCRHHRFCVAARRQHSPSESGRQQRCPLGADAA